MVLTHTHYPVQKTHTHTRTHARTHIYITSITAYGLYSLQMQIISYSVFNFHALLLLNMTFVLKTSVYGYWTNLKKFAIYTEASIVNLSCYVSRFEFYSHEKVQCKFYK